MATSLKTSKSVQERDSFATIRDVYFFALSSLEKINIARKGISKRELTFIKEEVELDYDQLATILTISRATLIAKKGTQKFNQETSERILLLNDIISYGYKIFGDKEVFNEWLKTPSEAFGNVTPLSLMDTFYGLDEVKKEIGRIAYGIY
ncbi:MAG: MbcA/ParS/Xre antitoxin family protein [Bacteroidota bacterium]